MKKLILFLLALCPLALMAQNTEKLNLPLTDKPVLIFLDGKKVDKAAVQGKLNQDDVSAITVIKDAAATAKYGADGANGAIEIVTTKAAIHAYQEKFSDFSADYESYLTSHGTDDKQFIYLIDNVALAKDKKEAGILMDIPKDKIADVVFVQDQPEGSKILAKVAITLKK